MNKSRIKTVTIFLSFLVSIGPESSVFASPLASPLASPKVKLERADSGISATLVDQGDYYLHPDGRKIKFYRKKDIYAVETKGNSNRRRKGVGTMARFSAQFGERVSQVKSHRLGSISVIRIDNTEQRTKSALPQSALKIQPSMLKALDSNISTLQPVLANQQGRGDILVTSKMLIKLNSIKSADTDISTLARRYGLTVIRRLTTSGAVFEVSSHSSVVANTSQRFSYVRRVMNDQLVDWAQPLFKSKPKKTAFQPTADRLFDRQWHLSNSNEGGSFCDADCDADNAWGIGAPAGTEGAANFSGANTVIAIIDDGVQLDHEDLQARIWVNPDPTPAVDEEGDGCINDLHGCDFVDDSELPLLLNANADLFSCPERGDLDNSSTDGNGVLCLCQDNDGSPGTDGDPSPQASSSCLTIDDEVEVEQDDHGTAVAGLAAASRNGLGVVGTAYSATILPIRLISEFDGDPGDDFCSRAVEAMTYAGRYADVINNSWSIEEGTCPALDTVISLVVDGELTANSVDMDNELLQTDAVNISKRPNLGSPVIFSAGNDASGWIKITAEVTTPGEHAYEWRFLRGFVDDGSITEFDQRSLDSTVWLDDIDFPGPGEETIERFENGIPSGDNGFSSGCVINQCVSDDDSCFDFSFLPGEQCVKWSINTDQDFSRSGNSATVAHTDISSPCNHSYISTIKDGPAGEISFWIWVSTDLESFADKVEFLIDGQEQFSFGDLPRFVDNGVAYPARLPKVIAVGASDSGDLTDNDVQFEERTSYSQYGPQLDVLAPSSNQHLGVVTTDRYTTPTATADGYNVDSPIDDEASPGRYTNSFSGTSASAPMVAGIAAAMIASNSSITAADVEITLQATADKIGRRGTDAYADDGSGTGRTRSDFYGYGRVNMFQALQSVIGGSDTLLDQSCNLSLPSTYTPENDLILPNFRPQALAGLGFCPALGPAAPDDSICLPIRTRNGGTAVICL